MYLIGYSSARAANLREALKPRLRGSEDALRWGSCRFAASLPRDMAIGRKVSRRRRRFANTAMQFEEDLEGVVRRLRMDGHALRDAYGKRVRVYGVADEGAVGFCLDFFSKGCAGCTRHWFDQGMDFSNEQLVELISLCIPAGIAKYFQ